MSGIITEIQRFSLHDGPGIRTTVFLKGCNMRCDWCHNPETIQASAQLLYYPDRCIGCGQCFLVCPEKAHILENGRHILDRERCVNCGRCAAVCYTDALVMAGENVSVSDIMKEVRQDLIYYKESNGGVTLSGGEVLCQKDFALAIVNACHAEDISVAIETNLNADFSQVMDLAKVVDLVMFDIKIFDSDEHQKHTGVGNNLILNNARKLSSLGVDIIVRTPLIPSVTDQEKNIEAISGFVSELPHVRYYELLNFNPLGASKYTSMGLDYPYKGVKPLSQTDLTRLARIAEAHGVKVKIG